MRTLNWNVSRYNKELETVAMERLGRVADLVEVKARELVPVNTGELKASIRIQRGPGLMYRIIAGNSVAWYCRLVEYKNHGGKRPYMRPALSKSKARGRKILEGEEG